MEIDDTKMHKVIKNEKNVPYFTNCHRKIFVTRLIKMNLQNCLEFLVYCSFKMFIFYSIWVK